MITWDLVQSAILYCGLLVFVLWRMFFPWQPGRTWKKTFNHFTILYGLISLTYVVELVMFLITAHKDFHADAQFTPVAHNVSDADKVMQFADGARGQWPIPWLRTLMMCVPVIVPIIIVMTGMQSRQHLQEICQDSAQMQHDRVINIIALPAVYAVVVMCGLARVYELVVEELIMEQTGSNEWAAGGSNPWKDAKATSFAEYETCMFVGDLYEAWALFQFGKLTMELLENSWPESSQEEEDASPSAGTLPPRALSVQAISSVLWLGTGLFILVNLVQTGWALYAWFFQNPTNHWEQFESTMSKFSYAGLVASSAAIYNVHIVESIYGHYINGYAPFLKFLSVKILVFFAFWQGPCLWFMKGVGALPFTDVQMKLLQATLLIFECLFCSCLHIFAWGSQEQWYAGVGEKTPLLDRKDPPTWAYSNTA